MTITQDIIARASLDLRRAEAAAARAREALTRAEADIADLSAFLRTLERYTGSGIEIGNTRSISEHSKNTVQAIGNGSRGAKMVDVAISAIRDAGKPLPIGDLLDAVLEAGFAVGGVDQKSNLAGYLSRDPRVASLGRNIGWDIVYNEELSDSEDANSSSEFEDLLGSPPPNN